MRNWKILANAKEGLEKIIKLLLSNRELKTKKDAEEFLNPKLSHVTSNNVAINTKDLKKAVARIKKAIENQEQIIVYGDYDVDGICGTAILWETLNALGANAMPYIPHRIDEGYGLSIKGIENITRRYTLDAKRSLIITVDNGIVANDAVDFANEQGIDVIITDHHVLSKRLPKALAIVHTTKLCGAGVAYLLSQNIKYQISNIKYTIEEDEYLELVALATIADLVPLLGVNRTLTKYGLEKLRMTKRIGLLELFKEAGLDPKTIDTYEVGHIIAPRLNATGRITHAIDSLRLLCTKDPVRAKSLANKLDRTNRERQLITEETVAHATGQIRNSKFEIRNLIFIANENYQQGVIGLVAGKLVEEFYRPAIVVSKGKQYSKASARSIRGFNIIEFIRSASEFLMDAGGHPMAAGFTVETEKLARVQHHLEKLAEKMVGDEHLTRILRIDCEIDFSVINHELYEEIQKFAPFGMGNPQPTFITRNVIIDDMRLVGNDGKHLKFRLSCHAETMDAIAFNMGGKAGELHVGDLVDIVYTIEEDNWNGNKKLQLKIKDLRLSKAGN